MADEPNGVIYLEADEDITSAIDKLTKSAASSVQVVTAKRSTLFQSVINVRLLKKASDDAKKTLVLVTGDRVATNLAGRIGVPVATQVGEAPRVPAAAAATAALGEDEIDGGTVGDVVPAASAAVAEKTPVEPTKPVSSPSPTPPPPPTLPVSPAAKKGSRVPNIGVMQKRLLWVGGAVLLIALLLGLSYYFTNAKVTLYAKASQVNASFRFTADPNAQHSDSSGGVLAAQQLSNSKSLTASVQATGTKDEGTKASGQMTITNEEDSSSHTLVAGTRFVASDGKVFRSNSDATVPGASVRGGGLAGGTTTVQVTADQNGDSYNEGPGKYSIPGESGMNIYGQGSQMQGGTTKTAKVVTQADVSKAEQAALANDKSTAATELQSKASKKQTALDASLQQTVSSASSSPDVGAEAQTATLTIQVSYTELAVDKSALSDLAKAQEGKQLGPENQIYDDGSGSLHLTPIGKPQGAAETFKADATAYAGTKIDTNALATQLKGQKYGDAVETATHVPGVEKAEVAISPSWATSVPHIVKHIHVQIKVASANGQ